MQKNVSLFLPLTKVDEEQRMVYGFASTPELDSQGEIITIEALEKALPGYMKFANIREMHMPSAVGKTKQAEVNSRGLYIGAKVVDDSAWQKVKEEVYNGFSVGGYVNVKKGREILDLDLVEISLVDRPANPDATFDVWKRDRKAPVAPWWSTYYLPTLKLINPSSMRKQDDKETPAPVETEVTPEPEKTEPEAPVTPPAETPVETPAEPETPETPPAETTESPVAKAITALTEVVAKFANGTGAAKSVTREDVEQIVKDEVAKGLEPLKATVAKLEGQTTRPIKAKASYATVTKGNETLETEKAEEKPEARLESLIKRQEEMKADRQNLPITAYQAKYGDEPTKLIREIATLKSQLGVA